MALLLSTLLKKSVFEHDDETFLKHVEAVNKATEICKYYLR